ncbi:hypothetical protein ACFYYR_01615 [Streptomyces sp. NPDC001922]|uniref:hypothetical protein n=1 Tax=Streptomyces sp. NPDC001922 TaxID=3364624 RepID=UPI0036B77678
MPMLSRQEVEVYVEFYALWAENADEEGPGESPEPAMELLESREGRLVLRSGGHTHRASVTAEVWDGTPPKDERPWEASAEAEWLCPSGEVSLWSYGGPSDPVVELGEAGLRWRTRAYVTGQERVRELAQQEVPAGVEQFLLQFWPA